MSKLNIAPKFGETSESIDKAFKWWEAEHDRAVWEDDQKSEEERQAQENRWKELSKTINMSYWEPQPIMRPYYTIGKTGRSKNITPLK